MIGWLCEFGIHDWKLVVDDDSLAVSHPIAKICKRCSTLVTSKHVFINDECTFRRQLEDKGEYFVWRKNPRILLEREEVCITE